MEKLNVGDSVGMLQKREKDAEIERLKDLSNQWKN